MDIINYFIGLTAPLDPKRSFIILKESNNKPLISTISIFFTLVIVSFLIYFAKNGLNVFNPSYLRYLGFILFTIFSTSIISSILFSKVHKTKLDIINGLHISAVSSFPISLGELFKSLTGHFKKDSIEMISPNHFIFNNTFDTTLYFNIGLIIFILLSCKGLSVFYGVKFRKLIPLAFGIFISSKFMKMLFYAFHI